ncbi:MAG: hypothetical protein ACP5PW_04040, partial [Candidatus Dormibacteria bacterium]
MNVRRLLTAAVAAVLLAGCGAVAHHRSSAVAANLLGSSGSAALGTSFEANYSATVSVSLQGVSGLPAATLQQLQQAASKLSGSTISGQILYQSSGTEELSYSLPALFPGTVHLLEVGGAGYISLNGTQWYALKSGAGSTWPGGVTGLQTQLRRLLSSLKSATKVTDLGSGGTVNGLPTEHIQAELPGSALAADLSGALGGLGQPGGATPGAGILAQLVTFGTTTVDGWVATTDHLPQRLTSSSSATLDLGALSMLAPSST